ncbi:binding-protein-dependent transport systems inner membrane component [Thioalkalivibrio sp. K90mix]|uniref:ABC transporter permease n=1 Tax=Thioalkalivibrio sp. (strain K90mix) TaxID=396595 RepID=UPI000195A8C0|nr:ABC transporter permease [Thioalkalivibrio sp. K90mix]ADC71481.1 binding-protein-dependent transport systems inner membrane component [Thioalkalivibrio sp. K90mix]
MNREATMNELNPALERMLPFLRLADQVRRRVQYPAVGIAGLFALWWWGGWLIANNEDTMAFASFAPGPTLTAFWDLVSSGNVWKPIESSLYRVGWGLFYAIAIGVPLGVMIGYFLTLKQITHVPFQFLRMISPLAWMPIAVLAFATWDGASIFLIAIAAIWPITYATAHGVQRIDPMWLKVGSNLGANPIHTLRYIVMPAIAQDVFAGIRLAVGVAWIVLVPAEYLGVTSGLGYAINDARDTLEYDKLAAFVLVIGIIGYMLDAICVRLIKRSSYHAES